MVFVLTPIAAAAWSFVSHVEKSGSLTSENSQKSTPWVDIPTAAALLGRSQAYVRRQIKAGTLHAERDRCLVVRREDVEHLR